MLLWSQVIFTGKSPLNTEHCNEAISPEFADSSPKSKGKICGGTVKWHAIQKERLKYH